MAEFNDIRTGMTAATERGLWVAAQAGGHAARERLILAYLSFARMLAAKAFARRIDNDLEFGEYLQFATVGLVEAVDRYDNNRDVQFTTFALQRINGAILNGIEHLSEKREQLATRKRLLDERRDTIKEESKRSDSDVFRQLAEAAIGLALGFILEDPSAYEHEDAVVSENQYSGLELRQMRHQVQALVENLPERERAVIKYHYLNQVPFHTIAEILGVSKGRISQLHLQALKHLRESIKSMKACDLAW